MKKSILIALLCLSLGFSAITIYCTWHKPRIEIMDTDTHVVGIEHCDFYHGAKDCVVFVELEGKFATLYMTNTEATIIKDKARSILIQQVSNGKPVVKYKLIGWE